MLSIRFLSVAIVAVASVVLGLITLLNNYQRKTNKIFFIICLVSGVYTAVNYLADFDVSRALFWVRLTFTLAGLFLYATMIFANSFPSRVLSRTFDWFVSVVVMALSIVTFLPGLVPGITRSQGISNVVVGPLYPIYIIYVIVTTIAIIGLLLTSMRRTRGIEAARVRYVFWGLVTMTILVSLTNLFLPLLTHSNEVSIYGTYPVLIFLSASMVAIIRHRLFDIRLVVARSLAYLLLLLTLGGSYGLAVFGISSLLFPDAHATSAQNWLYIGLAIVLAFTFQPLRRFFEKLTDSIFYRDRYDSEEVLNAITKVLATEIDLDPLLDKSLHQLCRNLHVEWGQFFVIENDQIFKVGHFGRLPQKLVTTNELKILNRTMLVADELEGGERKTVMEDHNIRLSLALRTKEEFVGYLLLGDKLSGDIYTTQDIDLLEILTGELAVAVQNAKAYEQIQRFNITLQEKVDEATHRLRVANRHLKELDKAKDEFISMASHQLRTPLTTIKGYISMLMDGDAGKVTPKQREFLDYAFGGSDRMVHLINDMLNVSRMTSGKFLIEKTLVDLVKVTADEVRQLQSHAEAKGLKLVFNQPVQPLPPVQLDEGKTRQVIMNFIDNALYYTKQGSVTVALAQDAGSVRLTVKDAGIGVAEADKDKLFAKFYRAENAKLARPDGTGLGLYLAKRVVEDQGGKLIFESEIGKGSTFGFELPIEPPALPEVAAK